MSKINKLLYLKILFTTSSLCLLIASTSIYANQEEELKAIITKVLSDNSKADYRNWDAEAIAKKVRAEYNNVDTELLTLTHKEIAEKVTKQARRTKKYQPK